MGDLLQDGAAFLGEQLRAHCSQTVTYRRGTASVAVAATIGRTEWEAAEPDSGVVRSSQSRDFIVSAADLVLAGQPATPEPGDRIDLASGERFEVMSPGDEPVWRWTDGYQRRRRIHTKQVAT